MSMWWKVWNWGGGLELNTAMVCWDGLVLLPPHELYKWPTRAVPRSAFSGSCRSAKMNGREDQDQARKWQSNAVQHHHPIASSKQASGVYLFLVSSSVRLICFGFLFLLGSSRNFEGIVCLLWKLSWSYSVTNIWKAVVFPDPVLVCFDCKQLWWHKW